MLAGLLLAVSAGAAEQGRGDRDPFWPVGYLPAGRQAAEPAKEQSPLQFSDFSPEEQALIRQHTKVTGILKQRAGYYAIINNQVVRPGDTLTIQLNIKRYRFYIRSITTRRVLLDYIRPDEEKEPPEKESQPKEDAQ